MDARPIPPNPTVELYGTLAEDLLEACRSADDQAIAQWASRWVEGYADDAAETQARLRGLTVNDDVRAEMLRIETERVEGWVRKSGVTKLEDAQKFVARHHGYESWPIFVKAIDAGPAQFETAVDAIVSGDAATLGHLLKEDPKLVHQRSAMSHRSTLLHYVSANGVEDYRQKTPANIAAIARMLLEAGAEVNAESTAYGGGSTALGLAATSVHPERAGVQEKLLAVLIEYGAEIDRQGVAGNKHSAVEGCFWNGRGKAARYLALHGAELNLETAAGTGVMEAVHRYFDESTPRQRQRGLAWACQFGHREAAEFLLDRGVDIRDHGGTGCPGLHWALMSGHLDLMATLLRRGAPLEDKNEYDGTALGAAGYMWEHGDRRVDWVRVFEMLLAAGSVIEDGWLWWIARVKTRTPEDREKLAEIFRRYGATR